MDHFTRPLVTFQTPRSANGAADYGAGIAVQIVRDLSAGRAPRRLSSAPYLDHSSSEGLTCTLLDAGRLDLVVFNHRLEGRSVQELEATRWRRLLIQTLQLTDVSELPFSGSHGSALSTLEWSIAKPTISHAGLFLALHVYLRCSPANHRGHRFIRSYARSIGHAANSSNVSGCVFTWYLAGSVARGRVRGMSPGMLSLPSALRWAIFSTDHIEWDISLCHIAIFVSVLAPGEGDELVSIWRELCTDGGRKRIDDELPDGKTTFLRVFNSLDPQLPGSSFDRWWRVQTKRPAWFLTIVDLVAALRPRVLARLRSRGFGLANACTNARNETFFALSEVEATVMRSFLLHLRSSLPIFSHGLVHDAVYIHKDISDSTVHRAFGRAISEHGFPALQLKRKSWEKARTKAMDLLAQHNYRSDLKLQTSDLPSRRQSLWKHMAPTVDNLWMSYVRVPKVLQ